MPIHLTYFLYHTRVHKYNITKLLNSVHITDDLIRDCICTIYSVYFMRLIHDYTVTQ